MHEGSHVGAAATFKAEGESAAAVRRCRGALLHILDDVDVLRVDQVPELVHVLQDRLTVRCVESLWVREEGGVLDRMVGRLGVDDDAEDRVRVELDRQVRVRVRVRVRVGISIASG